MAFEYIDDFDGWTPLPSEPTQTTRVNGGGNHSQARNPTSQLNQFDSLQHAKEAFADRCKYNLMRSVYEVRDLKTGQWVEHPLDRINLLYMDLADKLGKGVEKGVVGDCIRRISHQNEYHPLRDYMERVAREVDPAHHILDNIVDWVFGGASSPHANEVMRLFLIAAVARVFHPGTYYRHVPVLAGEKEIGKSFFKLLSPPLNGIETGTVVQGRNHAPVSMDQVVHAGRRSLILEISEINQLINSKTTDLEAFKTYVSACQLEAEFKGTNTQPVTVSWCTYGTTNCAVFLKDELVDRVLPISLFHLKPQEFFLGSSKKLFEHRDAIWSAAVHAWRTEFKPGEEIKPRQQVIEDLRGIAVASSSQSPWLQRMDNELNFSERIILEHAQVARVLNAANNGNKVSDGQLVAFMQGHNWVKKHGRFGPNPEAKVHRWVHVGRLAQAGTHREAFELDLVAAAAPYGAYDQDGDDDYMEPL